MATVTAPSDQARAGFVDAFGYVCGGVAVAPGRVNLIGEHTDYNDGFVLPMAIERGVSAAFAPRDDGRLRAHALAFGETRDAAIAELTPEDNVPRVPRAPRDPRGHWFAYVAGMMWAMRRAGLPVGGLDVAIAGDVPIGAGLSSSAAIEMAVARAACATASIAWNARSMARLGQQAENEFVGVSCGIMDQLASAASEDGHALLVDCRSLETRLVPIPAEASFVVMDTGVRRSLAGSEYNDRRAACERAVKAVRTIAPGVHALRDVDAALLERARGAMDEAAYRRAHHVVHEIRRPLDMADALNAGDLAEAGRLMNVSHASLRDFYDVSSPELDAIVALAREHAACFGARLTGAGFGGCAVALVASGGVEEFRRHVGTNTFSSRPAGGAHLLE
jgi:galactokinase